MARGHVKTIRRSLSTPEWIRIRIAEIMHWKECEVRTVSGWEMRAAEYTDPHTYRFCGGWSPIRTGEFWGQPDGACFFRKRIVVPKQFCGLPVRLRLPTLSEMMVRIDGKLINAFDPNRDEIPLLKRARGGEIFNMEIEAYVRSAPDDMRVGQFVPEGYGCVQTWRDPELVSSDPVFTGFLYDLEPVLETAGCEQVDEGTREALWTHLNETVKRLDRDTQDRQVFHASVKAAGVYLKKNVYDLPNHAGPGALALVGHSHLDVAYYWQIRHAIRKNARTTAVQLALMDEYPEMRYCHTQPFLYESLKTYYPELYRRLKKKIKDGQWEIVGAPYVEPDCQVPAGESLIRQCLLGKLFFLEEFGVDVDTCWLPDVFGNSWIMPQILVRSGVNYFVSNKMSTWNDTNRFPHNTFLWRGVDGTSINSCVPASHFISWLAPDQLLDNWNGFQEKTEIGESMNMFGFGDGGGGLTREMLETGHRISKFPGLPKTRMVSAKEYLEDTFAKAGSLETWDDELFLEMHRGTHTTKGILKKLNRQCETVAREAELFSVLADIDPRKALTTAWKQVLVNQFHDILPGSHTLPVGRDAIETYTQALNSFSQIKDKALKKLAAVVDTTAQPGRPLLVFNSLNWSQSGVIDGGEGGGCVCTAEGTPVPSQTSADGRLIFTAREVPSMGHALYFVQEAPSKKAAVTGDPSVLENPFFRLKLDKNGEITSLIDLREKREVIVPGQKGNRLELFEDKPGVYDAWDIIETYKDNEYALPAAESVILEEQGPVRTVVRIRRTFLSSSVDQRLILYNELPRIDFVTTVEWHERNKMLKVAFPVDVLSRTATYDLSYGAIQRPTHTNTTWDQAKFEVCGHQWADLSAGRFGVSLLNDSKYGWDIRGQLMRLTLLRGSIRPDPYSDDGCHTFTYSLFPHAGTWQQAGTVHAARNLNTPLTVLPVKRHRGPVSPEHSYLTVPADGVFVGALKPAERGSEVVLRLAELHGDQTPVSVQWDRMATACECDLIERPETNRSVRGGRLNETIKPYQIRSFRLTLKPSKSCSGKSLKKTNKKR
jgi:alpha-mannosidase